MGNLPTAVHKLFKSETSRTATTTHDEALVHVYEPFTRIDCYNQRSADDEELIPVLYEPFTRIDCYNQGTTDDELIFVL